MKAWFITLFVVLSFLVCAPASAQKLRIGVGLSKPPYIIKETNSGVELDILRRALEIAGYETQPVYLPMKRILYGLNKGDLDGGISLRPDIPINGYLSESMITYQNFAISRAEENLVLDDLSDLHNVSVLAFQNANLLLGLNFSNAVEDNHKYSEISNQELQAKMFLAGRVQVLIADFRIFLHFKNKIEKIYGGNKGVVFHALFPPTLYHAGFKSEEVRNRFNKGLETLRQSGEYDQILARYINPDDDVRVRGSSISR